MGSSGQASGQTWATGLFWDGGAWAFRFAPTRVGDWSFNGETLPAGVAAISGTVHVEPPDATSGNGFLVAAGPHWSWQAPHLSDWALAVGFPD